MQTFSEYLTDQYPQYRFLLPMIETFIGKQPEWIDLTKSNLFKIKKGFLETLSANTVRTYVSILKSTFNRASEDVKIPCKDYETILNVRKEASTSVYLSEEELERLIRVAMKSKPERYVRTMFAIQAYTGSRLSDAKNLTEINIHGDRISYVSLKTKIETTVPLKPIVRDLIEQKKTLKPVTTAAFDRIIKRLCFRANIRQEEKIFRGGRDISLPKYLLVSSHTARRSFATNLHLKDGNILAISKYMGHSTINMTEKYVCCGMEDPDEKIKTFFK